jgi:hypothetical protein
MVNTMKHFQGELSQYEGITIYKDFNISVGFEVLTAVFKNSTIF